MSSTSEDPLARGREDASSNGNRAHPDERDPRVEARSLIGPESVGLWASLAVLGRRWRIVAIGMILTGAAVVGCFALVPPTYKAMGTVVLLSPASVPTANAEKTSNNPYLGFGGSLNAMAQVLVTEMTNEPVAQRVRDEGGNGEFKVDQLVGDAPIIRIEATGATPEEALATQRAVAQTVTDNLKRRQENGGASAATSIASDALSIPVKATIDAGSRIRTLAAVVVLGIAGTILLAFGAESLAQYRAQRLPARRRRAGSRSGPAKRTSAKAERSDIRDTSGSANGADKVGRRAKKVSAGKQGQDDKAESGEDGKPQDHDTIVLDDLDDRGNATASSAGADNGGSRSRSSRTTHRPSLFDRRTNDRHAPERVPPE